MTRTTRWVLLPAMTWLAWAAVPAAADDEGTAQTAAADTSARAGDDEAIDEEWLNTIWTQVDDIVKTEEQKLQETVTVAGVRGAEAEDEILDKLYYKGAKRYPSQDKLNKAIETLKKAIAAHPKGPKVAMQTYFIAQCYEKLGRKTEARQYYEQVSRDYEQSTWAARARKDLSRLAAAR